MGAGPIKNEQRPSSITDFVVQVVETALKASSNGKVPVIAADIDGTLTSGVKLARAATQETLEEFVPVSPEVKEFMAGAAKNSELLKCWLPGDNFTSDIKDKLNKRFYEKFLDPQFRLTHAVDLGFRDALLRFTDFWGLDVLGVTNLGKDRLCPESAFGKGYDPAHHMLVGPETTPDYTKGGVPKEMMKGDMVRAFVTGNPLVEICTAMENAPAHAVSLAGEGYKTVLVEHEPIPPYDRPLSRHLEEMPISKAQLIGSSIVTATPKELKAAFETQKFDQGRLTDLIFAKSGLETTVPFGRYGLAAVDIGASILMGMSIPYLIDGTFKMFGVYAHRDPAAYATGAGANLLVMQGMSSISKAALDTGLSEAASKGAYFAARSGNGMVFSRHQMTSFFEGAKGNILNIVSMFTAMPTVVAGNLAGRTVGLDPKLYEGMSLAAGFGLQTLVSLCGKRAMGMFTSVMAPTGVVLFFEGVGMSWYEHEVAGDRSPLDIYFREKAKADLNAFELFGYELGFYTLILPSGVLALMDGDVEDTPSARFSNKMEMEISANETRLKNNINEWPLQMQLYGALLRGSDEDLLRITKNEDFGYSCLKSVIKYLEERGEYAILKRLVKNNDVYKEVMKALSWIPSVQGISLSYQIGDDGQGDAQMLTETKLLWSFIFSMAAGDFQDSLEFASNIPLRADGRLANGADILERWNYAKDVLLKMGINELDLQEQIALGRIRPNTRFKSNITPADFAVSYRSALR